MDAWLSSRIKPDQPGASVIVVQDGKTILRAGYGMANMELGVPIAPEHVFRIGSITKQFTAVAILQLTQRKKLALTDRITKFVKRYPTGGHKITVEHLLTHTSGIKSYTEVPEFWKEMRSDRPLAEVVKFFQDQPMDFAPGERWHYNNSAYVLLGSIIEAVSGETYEAYLKRHIFDKLGMRHTFYDLAEKLIPGRVAGYGANKNDVTNTPFISMTWPHAAGALASNVDDLALWDAALYGHTVVSQGLLQQAWTPLTLKRGKPTWYGFGWAISPFDGATVIEHSGGINGFRTHALRVPEQRLFVAVLANSDRPALDPTFAADYLMLLALGKRYADPEPIRLSKKMRDNIVGRYKADDRSPITLSQKAGRLYIQYWDAMPPIEIFASQPDELFTKNSLNRIRIGLDDNGAPALHIYERETLRDTAHRQ